jgi:hypothetical protein
VNASGALVDGTKFDGPATFRQALMRYDTAILTNMTEKLLTYALGRGLEASDAPAVRKIKRDAARDNLRFGALVQGVVTSVPFQMKLAHSDTN